MLTLFSFKKNLRELLLYKKAGILNVGNRLMPRVKELSIYPAVLVSAMNLPDWIVDGINVISDDLTAPPNNSP